MYPRRSQVMATLYTHMPKEDVEHVVRLLISMTQMTEHWETRHAGFLALKYLVSIRNDVLSSMLPTLLPVLQHGYVSVFHIAINVLILFPLRSLQDPSDEVRMSCADCMLAVLKSGVGLSQDFLSELAGDLWLILQDLDDITPATTSIMNLLAEMYSHEPLPHITKALATKIGMQSASRFESFPHSPSISLLIIFAIQLGDFVQPCTTAMAVYETCC